MAGATERPPDDSPRSPNPLAPGAALRHWPAVLLFVLLTVAGAAADLWSKHAVFESLLADPAFRRDVEIETARRDSPPPATILRRVHFRRRVFPGFQLSLSTNPGVVFGLPMPPYAVAIATLLTIALVCWFFACSEAAARSVHAGLAMILAGAIGNFYDRMFAAVYVPGIETPITGQVRDFLDFSDIEVLGLNWPYIFNVADVWLVIGVGLLILHWSLAAVREHKVKSHAKPTR